jgi:hypothetical protein
LTGNAVRNGLVLVLGVWLQIAGHLCAQWLPATNPPEPEATADPNKPAGPAKDNLSSESIVDSSGYRIWARVEYLLWWMKDAPLPVPVVTTGDPHVGFDPNMVNTVNTAGAIAQRGTQILLGDDSIHSREFSGLRLTLGGWIDDEELFGVYGSGFFLERHINRFAVASDKAGNPPLYFPIFSAISGAERGIPIADPLRSFSGNVVVNSTLRLWGTELGGTATLIRIPWLDFSLLAGFRYADLRENLLLYNTTTDLLLGNVTSLADSFATKNQFYGGQIGSQLAVQRDAFSLDLIGKIALGSTHEVVDIRGDITQAGPNPLVPPGLGTFPGGLFAQSTNIGRRKADRFAVLPSLELRVGYEISERTRVFVGYDLMYWTEVVRPGNQINHNVNLSQNAVLDPNGAGRLVGPAQPAPLFNRSDFWAQGINLGLAFRF